MKHLTTAFLLTIIVFVTSASGDILPTFKSSREEAEWRAKREKAYSQIGTLKIPSPKLKDCAIDADVRIHIKPYSKRNWLLQKETSVLVEVTANFDIFCQEAVQNCEFGFPVARFEQLNWGLYSKILDFQISVDGIQSLPIKEQRWNGKYQPHPLEFGFFGYIWNSDIKPKTRHHISVRYSVLPEVYNDAHHFQLPISGANFFDNIKKIAIYIINEEPLVGWFPENRSAFFYEANCKHCNPCKKNEFRSECIANDKSKIIKDIWVDVRYKDK